MTAQRTYLDWNATAPLRSEARAAMIAALDVIGNPSSVHAEGRAARALVDDAREKVAALIGTTPSSVIFTSGATEANATVIAAGWDTIFVADIEHESVLHAAKATRARIVEIPVDRHGRIEAGAIADEVLTGIADPRAAGRECNGTGLLKRVKAQRDARGGQSGEKNCTDKYLHGDSRELF